MSLRTIYERFLASPDSASLSENASLNYIPTLQSFNHADRIIRHLQTQSRSDVRKEEKINGIVEGQNALSLDIETTLEFISGGGTYLPGLENFVTDKTVTFPTIHIVNFDSEGKIQRIRIHWDQGSLLRQVDVIGSRGKNWPITDANDQTRLIVSVLAGTLVDAPATRGRNIEPTSSPQRSFSPSKKRIADPHSSLANLMERGNEEQPREPQHPMIAPRVSAKPAPREYSELFAAGHEDHEPSKDGSPSPKKYFATPAIAPKGAGASRHQPSRLFEDEDEQAKPAKYKSHPAKYDHFELGGGGSQADQVRQSATSTTDRVPMRAKTDKHLSQWSFEDFMTPEKIRRRDRGQDARHFVMGDEDGSKSQPAGETAKSVQPRRDAEHHFEFRDDGSSDPSQRRPAGNPKGSMHDGRAGLYQNNLYDDESNGDKPGSEKEPLSTVTTNVGRSKNFDDHWLLNDQSPAAKDGASKENRPMAQDRKKAVQMMDANWESYDHSPEQDKKPAATKQDRRGMERSWGFGDEAEKTKPHRETKTNKGFWDI